MPRTMTAELERDIRNYWDNGTSGERLLRELDAERRVSKQLAEALGKLVDHFGDPAEGKLAGARAALAEYRKGL